MNIVLTQNTAIVSGVPNYVEQLALGMQQRGHNVWIIMPDGEMAKHCLDEGLAIVINSPQSDIDIRYIAWLRRFLIDNKIDILHTNMLKSTVNGMIAGRLAGTKGRIAHIHGTLFEWEVPIWKKLPNMVINSIISRVCATSVIALTPSIKEQLVKYEYIDRARIKVIGNAVDLPDLNKLDTGYLRSKLDIPSDYQIVGSFSRLTIEKGLQILIEAAPQVLKKCPKTHFVVVGEGEMRKQLQECVREQGIESKVSFLGFQPEQIKYSLISGFDVYAFPSTREGFGISLIEAMAAAVPVVCSDLPVLKDVVDNGRAGVLFKSGESKELAQALEKVLTLNNGDRNMLIKTAKHRVAVEYSVEKFINGYEQLYKRQLIS